MHDITASRQKIGDIVSVIESLAFLTGAAWKFRPSTYIVTTQDQTIHLSLQRAEAKRMGATVVEIESGHMPMSSHQHDGAQRHPQSRFAGQWLTWPTSTRLAWRLRHALERAISVSAMPFASTFFKLRSLTRDGAPWCRATDSEPQYA
jgi:hypothetical protein